MLAFLGDRDMFFGHSTDFLVIVGFELALVDGEYKLLLTFL